MPDPGDPYKSRYRPAPEFRRKDVNLLHCRITALQVLGPAGAGDDNDGACHTHPSEDPRLSRAASRISSRASIALRVTTSRRDVTVGCMGRRRASESCSATGGHSSSGASAPPDAETGARSPNAATRLLHNTTTEPARSPPHRAPRTAQLRDRLLTPAQLWPRETGTATRSPDGARNSAHYQHTKGLTTATGWRITTHFWHGCVLQHQAEENLGEGRAPHKHTKQSPTSHQQGQPSYQTRPIRPPLRLHLSTRRDT